MSSEIQKLQFDGMTLTPESAEEILCKLQGMKAAIREAEATIKARMIEIIQETGRDIVIGTKRYYVGHPTDTQCLSIRGVIEALLTETGGDLDKLAECLCSDPFKPGATLKVLSPEAGEKLFRKVQKVKLEEGKAKKQLLEFDSRFVR